MFSLRSPCHNELEIDGSLKTCPDQINTLQHFVNKSGFFIYLKWPVRMARGKQNCSWSLRELLRQQGQVLWFLVELMTPKGLDADTIDDLFQRKLSNWVQKTKRALFSLICTVEWHATSTWKPSAWKLSKRGIAIARAKNHPLNHQ